MLTSEMIKKAAYEAGADKCGIAPMSRFEGAPKEMDPRYLFPEAKSVIGFDFGIAFLDDLVFKTSLHSGAIAMLLSIAIVPLVSLFTKKQSKARLEEIFSCYHKEVTVKATAVLESKEDEKKN